MSVKNGAELLDRLMKDIVADAAASYVSIYHDDDPNRTPRDKHEDGADDHASTKENNNDAHSTSPSRPIDIDRSNTQSPDHLEDHRAFSLERFIPLLNERVYAISPYTRMHLVSWLMVLNTVPDLELVAYLPEFLDGLLKYLADTNVDVRVATENLLSEFLREIKAIAQQQEKQAETDRSRRSSKRDRQVSDSVAVADDESALDDEESSSEDDGDDEDEENEWEGEGSGAWEPGQSVIVDHAAIMDIIVDHLSFPGELYASGRSQLLTPQTTWCRLQPWTGSSTFSILRRLPLLRLRRVSYRRCFPTWPPPSEFRRFLFTH